MKRNILLIGFGLFLLGVATIQTGPPVPPGFSTVSKAKLLSPKQAEYTKSLGASMVKAPSLFIPPNEFLITNVVAGGNQACVFWTGGSAPYQVEKSDSLNGPWIPAADPTILVSNMVSAFPDTYWRIRGSVPIFFVNTNLTFQPRLNWVMPQIAMSDTINPLRVQKRSDAPPANQAPDDNTGWTDIATNVPAGQTNFNDSSAGPVWYRPQEITVNGAVIPFGTGFFPGGSPPPPPGTADWARVIYGPLYQNNVTIYSAFVDTSNSNGDVVVCGSYLQPLLNAPGPRVDFGGGVTLPYNCSSGFIALFVAKYSKNNELIWVKGVTEGTGQSLARSVVVNSSGDIFVTGNFTLSMTINGVTMVAAPSGASTSGYLIKFNSSGTIQNTQVIGGTLADVGIGLNLDPSDNPVISGNFSGTATFDPTHDLTSAGGLSLFIAIYNKADLTISLLKGYGGTGTIQVNGFCYQATGSAAGFYVVGGLTGVGNFGGGNITNQAFTDMFVVKYNLSGDWQWNIRVGIPSTSGAQGQGVVITPSGKVLVTGYFSGNDSSGGQDGPKNVDFGGASMNGPQSGTAIFVAQYTPSGVCQWVKRYAGNTGASDICRAVNVDSSGNLYLVGSTTTSGFDNFFVVASVPKFLAFKMSAGTDTVPGTCQWLRTFAGEGQVSSGFYVLPPTSDNKVYLGGYLNGGADIGAPVNGDGNQSGGVFNTQNGFLLRVNP